tara:strand:- start:35 stop:565 length:531 start_codon:yes stop_codon:yes gene_type:complete
MGLLTLQSCYVTSYTYVGNTLDNSIGLNKNQVLRTIGVPERTMGDGDNGEILIYEKFSQTTLSSATAYGSGKSNTNSNVTFGFNSIYGNSNTRTSAQIKSYGYSKTYTSKIYRNIYLNQDGIVYDYQTNFGGKYDSYKCLHKGWTWYASILFLGILSPAVAVPVIKSAKKKGRICN